MELVRVSGAAPERLCGGDDSSENSSESSCYEVMDTNGEIVHMAKRLTCRVGALVCSLPGLSGAISSFLEPGPGSFPVPAAVTLRLLIPQSGLSLNCTASLSLQRHWTHCLTLNLTSSLACLSAAGPNQGGDGSATEPLQLRLLSVHVLGARGGHGGSSHCQSRQAVPSQP